MATRKTTRSRKNIKSQASQGKIRADDDDDREYIDTEGPTAQYADEEDYGVVIAPAAPTLTPAASGPGGSTTPAPSGQATLQPRKAKGRSRSVAQVKSVVEDSMAPARDTEDIKLFSEERVTSDGQKKRFCSECPAQYALSTSSGVIRRHMVSRHLERYIAVCEENNLHSRVVQALATQAKPQENLDAAQDVPEFTPQNLLRSLIRFISADEQRSGVVDVGEFRLLLRMLKPDLADGDIPREPQILAELLGQFKFVTDEIRAEFEATSSRISTTVDIGQALGGRAFMSVTAHFIRHAVVSEAREKLELASSLVAFHPLKAPENPRTIARTMKHIFQRAGIIEKLGHITARNDKLFDDALLELKKLFTRDKISGLSDWDPKERRVMSIPHTVHISMSRAIRESFGEPRRGKPHTDAKVAEEFLPYSDEEFVDPDGDGQYYHKVGVVADWNKQTVEQAFERNPLTLIRGLVRGVRNADEHRGTLFRIINDSLKRNTFTDQDNGLFLDSLPEAELLLDFPETWDSTYQMVTRAQLLRPALDHFATLPSSRDVAEFRLSPTEWSVVNDIQEILEIPRVLLCVMSRENLPNLSVGLRNYEHHHMALAACRKLFFERENKTSPSTKLIDVALKWGGKYYDRTNCSKTYVICLFLDPTLRLRWDKSIWKDIKDHAMTFIASEMALYRPRAVAKHNARLNSANPAEAGANVANLAQLPQQVEAPGWAKMDVRYKIDLEPQVTTQRHGLPSIEAELHAYAGISTDSRFSEGTSSEMAGFWGWKEPQMQFPTIYEMALDYLPIQASFVPCEPTFSSSADKRQRRLSPTALEALQVLKHWYKRNQLSSMARWSASKVELAATWGTGSIDHLASLMAASTEDQADVLKAVVNAIQIEEGTADSSLDRDQNK